jgi:hypothetical protein
VQPSTNRFVTAVLALGLVAVVLVTIGWAARRDDPSDAERWADSVCSALDDWRDDVVGAAESVRDAVSDDGILGGLTTLDDAYFEIRDATSALADELRAIGAPDTEAGRAAEAEIRQLAERLDSLVGQLLGAASSTSVITNADDLVGLVDDVASSVQALRELDPLGELRDAISGSKACQELLPSGG